MTPAGRYVRPALAGLGALIALVLLVWWVGPARLQLTLAAIGWRGTLWLLLIYTATMAARTGRFLVGLPAGARPSFLAMGAISSLHQLSNHLLPARLGELTFPYLLQRGTAVPADLALAALLRVRLQELSVLGTVFLLALATLRPAGLAALHGWPALIALGLATMSLPLLVERLLSPALHGAGRLLPRLLPADERSRRHRWGLRLAALCARIATENRRPYPWHKRCATFALTLLTWLLVFLLFQEAMRLSGHPVSLGATVIGSSFANLAQLLPINTWGSIGSMEAGWTFGFALVGVPAAQAMATAIIVHLLTIAFLVLFSLPAWLWFRALPGHPRLQDGAPPPEANESNSSPPAGLALGGTDSVNRVPPS